MEVDEIQAQQPPCKFPRIGNGGRNTSLAVHNLDEEEVMKRAGGGGEAVSTNRLNGWHHSRIIRVSRASGGKDRHSKVWTSKGLRDRRVRLSVSTAIQFYDLQDRLGYDQPSKAVEWLIKAASDAISELPSLSSTFPDTPKQLSDEKRGGGGGDHVFDAVELDMDGSPNYHHQPQQLSQSQTQNQQQQQNKSACSSNSETSKGSGLSLSRSEIRVNRVKARERARERAAKVEKDSNNEASRIAHAISQNAPSFTELLTGGSGGHSNSPTGRHHQNNNGEPLLFHKAAAPPQQQQPTDYFGSGLLGLSSSSANRNHHHSSSTSGFFSLPQTMFSISGHPGEMQHFSFVPDYIPVSSSAANGGEYNLNFSMSTSSASGGALAGFNRGTLQSNSSQSPSLFQRFSPLDGSNNVPFFMGAAAAAASSAAAAPPMENHHHQHQHQHQHQFPAGLQLYGDGTRPSDHKGKAKN